MRRSQAPSKFRPPGRVQQSGAVPPRAPSAAIGEHSSLALALDADRVTSNPHPLATLTNQLGGGGGGSAEGGGEGGRAAPHRKPSLVPPPAKRPRPASSFTPLHRPPSAANTVRANQSAGASTVAPTTYFKVVYRKSSRKVHKAWEGDGFLECRGPIATIKDEEGKTVTQGRIKGAAELSVGSEIQLGGKELELTETLPESEWTSGRCFLTSTAVTAKAAAPLRHGMGLPKGPLRLGKTGPAGRAAVAKPKVPLFSPDDPGAVVLSRPGPDTGSVAVVIDPFLASHLRAHQVEGVQFLYAAVMGHRSREVGITTAASGAILADEMGLGKTIQCITLMWTLLRQGPEARPIAKRVLIVTPASLIKNWQAEIRKWLGDERLKTYAVSKDLTPEGFTKYSSQVAPVMIVSYESVVRHIEHIRAVKFDLIICDEAHRLKNSKMKTNTLLSSLSCPRRVCLTGTPVQNDLKEFFAIADFAVSGALGSAALFAKVYEEPILRARQPKASAKDKALGKARASELSSLIQSFFLRRSNEINAKYLPPKHEYVVFVRPTPTQARVYDDLVRSKTVTSCFASASGASYLIAINSLRKAANCPRLLAAADEDDEAAATMEDVALTDDLGAKLAVLKALLVDVATHTTDRVVVVSNSTQCLNVIGAMCTESGFKMARLDGSTPTEARVKIVDTFNAGTLGQSVFLLSTKAGGVGLNIVGASRLVLFDIDWNPAHDLQAMARVWRDGQTKPVHIYRLLLAGTIDEKIFQRQLVKQGLGTTIDVEGAGCGASEFSWQELRDLFAFHEGTACKTLDLIQQHEEDKGVDTAAAPTYVQLMEWEHLCPPLLPLPDQSLNRIQHHDDSAITYVFHREGNASSGLMQTEPSVPDADQDLEA